MATSVVDPAGDHLNIAAELERSVVNGPGARYVLWVQGCPFRCPGCFNPEFLLFAPRRLEPVEAISSRILSVRGLEGVTFSGGEPMAQAEGLFNLGRILKRAGFTVMCYTGFTLEELRSLQDPHVDRLLGLTDVLVDGRYEEAKRASLLWRGSSNQRVHFLSRAYAHLEGAVGARRADVEIVVGDSGAVLTGMTDREVVGRLRELLEAGGRRP